MLLDALDEVTRVSFTLSSDDHDVFWINYYSLHTLSILCLYFFNTKLVPQLPISIGHFNTKRQIVYEAEAKILMPVAICEYLFRALVKWLTRRQTYNEQQQILWQDRKA